MLDPLGPLCNLWALAITADDEQCEIPPAVVIDMVKRAISLVGNGVGIKHGYGYGWPDTDTDEGIKHG